MPGRIDQTDAAALLGGVPPRHRIAAHAQAALFAALFVALALLSLLPTLLTPIPAMVDYVNHLARMSVLMRDGTAQAHPSYHADWALYPNLAMDLVVPPLARMLDLEAAGRVFILLCELLVVTGAMALEYAVKRRVALSGFAALLSLQTIPFAWGFLNFEAGLGLALWGMAFWIGLPQSRNAARFIINCFAVAILFVTHFFALGLYGFVLGIHELWCARHRPFAGTATRFALLAAPAATLAALLTVTRSAVGGEGTEWHLALKPLWLFATLNGYDCLLSIAGTSALCLLCYLLAKRRALRMEQSGAWILASLAALYCAMPSKLFDTAFVDLRVLVAILVVTPAFLTIAMPDDRWHWRSVTVVSGIIAINAISMILVWSARRVDYAEMIAAFRSMDRGAKLLVADRGNGQDPPLRDLATYPLHHAPTLAVAIADAFVPTLYASPGKQPLVVRDDLKRLTVAWGGLAPLATLTAIAHGVTPAGLPSFVADWTHDFDDLCVIGPSGDNPLPDLLEQRAAGTHFTLYRIRRAR